MVSLNRRSFGRAVLGSAALAGASSLIPGIAPETSALALAIPRKRLTGADMYTATNWRVAGTDLGIPYVLENGSIGYLGLQGRRRAETTIDPR